MSTQRGGKRVGAGRPEGSRNARTAAIMEYLDPDKNNPVVKLVKIMNKAHRVKDFRLAAECAKALLPYYAPRPRLLDEDMEEIRTPIQVNVNFPIPGQHWQNQGESDDENQVGLDAEHLVE